MNFKTTIVLIVLLAAAGIYLFFTRTESAKTDTSADGSKLVDVSSKDITKIIVTPSDAPPFTLEKTGADWQITQPVQAPAETFEVDSLLTAFTDAKSRGEVDPGDALAKPHYQVQLIGKDKTIKLALGEKSAVGGSVYAQVDGNSKAEIVSSDLSDKLDKGIDTYRKMNLVTASSSDIKQMSITRPDGKLLLQKNGEHWQIVQPVNMPAEDSAVSDLTFALTGLRADSFVDPKSLPATAMAHPQLIVAFTTAAPVLPPATAPSTQPAWTTVQFGSYDDILKKNVFVSVEGSGSVAKVAATSLDSFKKKPLDLRDKKVVNIDPEQVSKVVLATDLPSTTQPTTRPAVNKTVVIERRKVNPELGPPAPTSQPTTTLATSAPTTTTVPAAPRSKWIVTSDPTGDAEDSKVTTLLGALHPLTVEKYLESAPTTQPAGRYVLTITAVAPGGVSSDTQITLTDPGHDQALIASTNGLSFEIARTFLSNLEGEWVKK